MPAEELARQRVELLLRSAGEALDAVEADGVVMAALGPVCGPELLRVKRDELARYERQVGSGSGRCFFERV